VVVVCSSRHNYRLWGYVRRPSNPTDPSKRPSRKPSEGRKSLRTAGPAQTPPKILHKESIFLATVRSHFGSSSAPIAAPRAEARALAAGRSSAMAGITANTVAAMPLGRSDAGMPRAREMESSSSDVRQDLTQQPVGSHRRQLAAKAMQLERSGRPSVERDAKMMELLTFRGCEEVLRGSSINTLLRRCAKIFKNSAGSAATYDLSFVVASLDCFVSHNWCVRWLLKFLGLAFKFNVKTAIIAEVLIVLVCAVLTYLGFFPTAMVPGDPDLNYPKGICCRLTAGVAFFTALVCAGDLWSCLGIRGTTAFLDKTCVHQTDIQLQRKSIEKLGAFICHSNEMIVLYSDWYLKKLWTIYEVAAFLSLHDVKKMTVIHLQIAVIFFVSLLILFLVIFGDALLYWFGLSTLYVYVLLLLAAFGYGFAVRAVSRGRAELQQILATFSVQSCVCAVESDRAIVYGHIAALVREMFELPRMTEDEALGAFNALVRDELPQSFASALGPFCLPHWRMIVIWLCAFVPVTADRIAGGLQHGMPLRDVAITAVYYLVVFGVGLAPLATYCAEIASRQFMSIRGPVEKAWVIFSTLCVLGLFLVTDSVIVLLRVQAAYSDVAFTLFVLAALASFLATKGLCSLTCWRSCLRLHVGGQGLHWSRTSSVAAETSAALNTDLQNDDARAVCNPDAVLTSESGNAASNAAARSCTAPRTADAEGGSKEVGPENSAPKWREEVAAEAAVEAAPTESVTILAAGGLDTLLQEDDSAQRLYSVWA